MRRAGDYRQQSTPPRAAVVLVTVMLSSTEPPHTHGAPRDPQSLLEKRSRPSQPAGAMAAPQCVVNAVLDALHPLGVDRIDMPLTPLRVWEAIRAAR